MKAKLKELFTGSSPRSISLLVAAGMLGMLLLALSEWVPGNHTSAAKAADLPPDSEYTEQLETQICQLIEKIEGAGKTDVMITLESGTKTVYARDYKSADTGGEEVHILLDTDTGQAALVEETDPPEIRGVAVVCQGADDIRINARITELVSVLLGVSTNRISIAKRVA